MGPPARAHRLPGLAAPDAPRRADLPRHRPRRRSSAEGHARCHFSLDHAVFGVLRAAGLRTHGTLARPTVFKTEPVLLNDAALRGACDSSCDSSPRFAWRSARVRPLAAARLRRRPPSFVCGRERRSRKRRRRSPSTRTCRGRRRPQPPARPRRVEGGRERAPPRPARVSAGTSFEARARTTLDASAPVC